MGPLTASGRPSGTMLTMPPSPDERSRRLDQRVTDPATPALPATSTRTPVDVLQTVFGYPQFRGDQAEVIDTLVAGGDALVLMPTGGGKSLCYQVPALVRPGTGVVISPLIALMQDQVSALAALGVRAAFLNSTQTAAERREVEAGVRRRRPRPAVPGARTAVGPLHAHAPGTRPGRPVRDRRGPLRLVLGPRLPARLPAAGDPRGALARRPPGRADRDRDPGHRRGDRHPARPARRPHVRGQLRPAEHRVPDRVQGQPARPAAAPAAHRARRRRRHRLLPLPQVGGGDREVPHPRGDHRAAVPRRPGRRGPRRAPGPVPARARPGDGGHHRVRHGHRQARRPVRRAPGPAEVGGGLLPGDRPRRPRRRARDGLAGLRAGGRGPAAQDDQRLRRGRDAPPAARAAPGRDAGALRDGGVPPYPAARATSESPAVRRAATATRAPRRRRPGTARSPRRSCCPRSSGWASAVSGTAPGTSSTSCSATRPHASRSSTTPP